MNDLRDLDRAIGPWLEQRAAARTPEYVDEMLDRVARVRQRPAVIAGLLGPKLPARRLERPLVLIALVGLLVAALLGMLLVTAGSRDRDALRAPGIATFERAANLPWQATPLTAGPDLGAWLDAACIAQAVPSSGPPRQLPGTPRRVLLDIRGEGFVLGMYAAGQLAPDAAGADFAAYAYGTCFALVEPDGDGQVLQAGLAPCASCPRRVGPTLPFPAFDHGGPDGDRSVDDRLPGPLTSMTGRARTEVTRVVIVLAGGQLVEATVGDGWFTAWWPAGGERTDPTFVAAARVLAYGTSGEPLADVPAPSPYPRPSE